jgi:hypothetical protein
MSTTAELVRAALVTPDAAGALADHLDAEGDRRGTWLRIRWRRFRTEYHRASEYDAGKERRILGPVHRAIDAARAAGFTVECKVVSATVNVEREQIADGFRAYIRERFAEELQCE